MSIFSDTKPAIVIKLGTMVVNSTISLGLPFQLISLKDVGHMSGKRIMENFNMDILTDTEPVTATKLGTKASLF